MTGPTPATVAAIDLGAASGRVMLAQVAPDTLRLREVHRFDNEPVRVLDTLHWDILRLYQQTVTGLRAASRQADTLHSAGIDSWAVDYGLLDRTGALRSNPVHYRDTRTDGVMDTVVKALGADALYQRTGLALLPFNTLFQLVAAAQAGGLAGAARLLLIPDLLGYWLTGKPGWELTNASTTQLLDVHHQDWDTDLITAAGLPPALFGPIRPPGSPAGTLREQVGIGPVPLTSVGSHDTASAVVAVPMRGPHAAYISCGTWSLVGLELAAPVLTEASRQANFTNEAGVDGTVRYLRNVMGLWLLQESIRHWRDHDQPYELSDLLAAAAQAPGLVSVVDAADPDFLAPGDLPARIRRACARTGQPPPGDPPALVRCILDSLALAHRAAIRAAQRLADRSVEVVHMVGGGARNALLCQLTADACELPVVAGPVEATAIGNALVQARRLAVVAPDLAALRRLVRDTQPLHDYAPAGNAARWREAAARIGLEG